MATQTGMPTLMLPDVLTDDQRAELERLGTAYVRLKIVNYAGGHTGRKSMIGGFDTGDMMRKAIEDWLVTRSAQEAAEQAKEQADILKWAKIAAWAAIAGVVITIIVAILKRIERREFSTSPAPAGRS